MNARTCKALLILTLMAISFGLHLFNGGKAYSQGITLSIAHDDEPECGDSDGDGQCDNNTQMD